MRTTLEYMRNAEECRKLARLMAVPDDKRAFEEMAQTWELLANLRARDVDSEND